MSHARDTYDKKHGRRKAGSWESPKKKKLKGESARAIRHESKNVLRAIQFEFLDEMNSASPEIRTLAWELVNEGE